MAIAKPVSGTYCTVEKLDNGVYQFEFSERMRTEHKVRAGLDEFFDQIAEIYERESGGQVLRFMVLIEHSRLQEINYSIERAKALYKGHPHRPPTRTAMVVQQDNMARLLDTFIQLLHQKRDKVRFFGLSQRNTAMDWLLRED
ncbi:MAG: STAS/SEC14 domain-containing protein [Chloroflexi bacterium]|nr:STAS/SEC14 domain-containing protein [Chloroflexota bacterium]